MRAVVGVKSDANLVVLDVVLQRLCRPIRTVEKGIVEVPRRTLLLQVVRNVEVVVAINGHVGVAATVTVGNEIMAPRPTGEG